MHSFLPLAVSLCSAAALQLSTPQFVAVDIVLTSQRGYSNPFLNVSVQATFTCIGCIANEWPATLTRSAFWNGSNEWIVRFAPTAIGTWNFTTLCVSAACSGDAGVDGVMGSVTSVGYEGTNPLYSRGFVRIPPRENGITSRFMSHADGTPFFWLGDTHWMSADYEHLQDCNAPPPSNCTSIFRTLVDDRVAKGFSVYQTYFHGDSASWWSDGAPNWQVLNPTNFTQRLDVMIQYILAQGMLPALGIGLHYMSEEMPPASLASLAQYVSARYGAYPIVWITAQEVNAPNSNVTVWHTAAEALASDDALSYAHPYSTHMWVFENSSTTAEPTIWGTEPWHTYFATQGGHTGMGIRPQSHYQFYWDYEPQQPFLEAEAMYEEIICGPRYAYANDTRIAAYKSILSGSLGYTYGAAAVWLFRYDMSDPNGAAYNPNTWWWPGMNLPGSTHMSYLAAALRALPWWQLTPRFGDASWCNFTDVEETVLATANSTLYVVYSYGASLTLGSLLGMQSTSYNAQWYDVQTGVYTSLGSVTPSTEGQWLIPPKPDVNDWLLIVQAVAS